MRAQQIYVNVAVNDLEKSKMFFSKLGFEFKPEFTNEHAACVILSDNIFTMLLTKPFFKNFIPDRDVADPKKNIQTLMCINVAKRSDVDEIIKRAVAAGGRAYHEPQDEGFMYGQAFVDLDGHLWEVMSYEAKV
ncbi:MAG: VOC family protein [Bacteriovoracaceae bacterium]